jgi:hypothetical protein
MCDVHEPALSTQGSRRRRLWELDGHAHCPVIGVCLPITTLRRVVDKVLAGQALAEDYELHCGAIAECKRRTPIAEAIQRELDRRCALALRQAAKAKTTDALAGWWAGACERDLAAALWVTLTHPRCTPALETRVLGEVHMLQHQIGVARRVDVQRFDALAAAHDALARELSELQQRTQRAADEHARRAEVQQAELVQLRAQLISRDTTTAALREQLNAATADGAPDRARWLRDTERESQQRHALERALQKAQHELEQQRQRADELAAALAQREVRPAASDDEPTSAETPRLDERSVLCVGGRPASVPVYRELIERTGGRFMHHDGGDEDNVTKLDATLAAADLVICQAGCISHGAYWRVKEHCKRTGKRCVFVESPSAAGLKRALAELQPAAESER